MFEKINRLWKKHGFEILIVVAIIIIIIMALVRLGKKGTWSDSYIYTGTSPKKSIRKPPQESKGEIECRRVVQHIFNKPFPKARPDMLRNPVTGNRHNLELDCFNSELRLAIEYNGVQHYKYVPYFHKNYEAFKNQKYRDYMKNQMCKENGITLIEVPYTVKIDDIKVYLVKELKKRGYL